VKELADIKNNGTPAGICLLAADNMQEWYFTIQVLGDETVYKVSSPTRLHCPIH
jgi:ubiquitin-conjugating enzyme E2 W